MKWSVLLILLVFTPTVRTEAQVWREIVLLKSTRTDVERLLGQPYNATGYEIGAYRIDDIDIHVDYATGECAPLEQCVCIVPKDTVVGLKVYPQIEMSFLQLGVDTSKYEKTVNYPPELVTYANDEEGIIYAVYEDRDDILSITYLPSQKNCEEVIKSYRNNLPKDKNGCGRK